MNKKIVASVLSLVISGMMPTLPALANTGASTITGSEKAASVSLTGTAVAGNTFFDTDMPHVPDADSFGSSMVRHGDDLYVVASLRTDISGLPTPFFRYSISGQSWAKLPDVPGQMAAISHNGNDDFIYALLADASFFRYSISGNTWTRLAAVPFTGYAWTLLRNGSDDSLYAFAPNSPTGLFRYSISGNSWTTLASIPGSNFYRGGNMIRNGSDDSLYAFQGDRFFRYSISSNSWTSLAPVLGGVYYGSTMLRNGNDDDIYVQGNGPGLVKYSISSDSWTMLASAHFPRDAGISMVRRGGDDTIYVLQGAGFGCSDCATYWYGSTGFFAYSIFNDSWTSVATLPGIVLEGTMINDGGDDIYMLEGNRDDLFMPEDNHNLGLWRYSINGHTTGSSSGSTVSPTVDTKEPNNAIGGLSWTEGATLPAGTSVTVSLRTAQTAGGFIDNWTDFTDATAGCGKKAEKVTCSSSAIPVPLTDGGDNQFVQYKLTKTANGAAVPTAGNVVLTYVTTAEQPPNTRINLRPTGRLGRTYARFGFYGTETGSTYECKLDLGTFTPCTSPKIYSGLAEGPHAFQVRATGIDGSTDATPTTAKWTVDLTPPNTIIDLRPEAIVHGEYVSFTFHATLTNGKGNIFECRVIQGTFYGTFTLCASGQFYTQLAPGSYTFQVRAIDSAGNIDATPATASWTIGCGCQKS